MRGFERFGIALGVLTSLVFLVIGLIDASSSPFGGGSILGWISGLVVFLMIEALIFFSPRTYLWVRGEMPFFGQFPKRKFATDVIISALKETFKSKEFKEISKNAALIYISSFLGSFLVGFLYGFLTRDQNIPINLQAAANLISITFAFYLIAKKQKNRDWQKLITTTIAAWPLGLVNVFLFKEYTFTTFVLGLPFLLLIMAVTSWLVFNIKKIPHKANQP